MGLRSLKGKLLAAVSALVIISGLVIALLVVHQYSSALRDAMVSQVENMAQTIALNAADKILVNDLILCKECWTSKLEQRPLGYILIFRSTSSRPYLRQRCAGRR